MFGLRPRFLAGMAGIVLAMLACSCSKGTDKSNPLSLIPSDAVEVARIDMRTALIEAGCQSQGGVITLTDEVVAAIGRPGPVAVVKTLAANGPACRLNQLTVFTDSLTGMRHAIVPRVPDTEFTVEGFAAGEVTKSKFLGEVTPYILNNMYMLVGEDVVWIFRCNVEVDVVATVDGVVQRAVDSPMAEVGTVALQMADETPLATYYRAVPAVDKNPVGEPFAYILATLRTKESTATIEAQCYGPDWQPANPVSKLSAVDVEAFDRYIPRNTAFVAAMSADSEGYEAIFGALGNLLDSARDRLMMNAAISLFGGFDGTLAVAIAPGGNRETISSPDLRSWQGCVVLPLTGEISPEKICLGLRNTITRFGDSTIGISDTYDGVRLSLSGEGDVYIAFIGNNALISNYRIDSRDHGAEPFGRENDATLPYGCTDYDTSAEGACVYIGAGVAYNSELMHALGLNFGGMASINVSTDGVISAHLATRGSQAAIIPAILQLIDKK